MESELEEDYRCFICGKDVIESAEECVIQGETAYLYCIQCWNIHKADT